VDPKRASYYAGAPFFLVVARDFGTTISIRQYSRVIENPPSKRFVIRTTDYYLDLDATGRGLLRMAPSGNACGTWSVARASATLTLRREGVIAPPRSAWVTKANYFLRPLVLDRRDASARSRYVRALESNNSLANQWISAGGKLTGANREYDSYYADWFRC
jgi:hypothetical protein